MDHKKYTGLGLFNNVGPFRVYATYHPSSICYSVFVIFGVFACCSVFILDGYHRQVSMSDSATKSYYKVL